MVLLGRQHFLFIERLPPQAKIITRETQACSICGEKK
jgi:hypothetical protein